MGFKLVALLVAFLAVSLMYIHEFHPDKMLLMKDNPFVRTSVLAIHNFFAIVSHKLNPSTKNSEPYSKQEVLFTFEMLKKFDGEEDSVGIYLSILGKVYDVSKGKKHYGPGGSYHAFAGRDASRAFVTGDFNEEGLTDDVMGLTPEDLKSIRDWSQFYHQEYTYKGKLIGRYYSKEGERTDYYREVEDLIKKADADSVAKNADFLKYPPCNVEWTAESGSRVWCSNRSGGVERDWGGVPRKYFKPGSDSYRCACIQLTAEMKKLSDPKKQRKGNWEEYEGCSNDSHECYVKE